MPPALPEACSPGQSFALGRMRCFFGRVSGAGPPDFGHAAHRSRPVSVTRRTETARFRSRGAPKPPGFGHAAHPNRPVSITQRDRFSVTLGTTAPQLHIFSAIRKPQHLYTQRRTSNSVLGWTQYRLLGYCGYFRWFGNVAEFVDLQTERRTGMRERSA